MYIKIPEEMLNRFERKQSLETSPITSDMLQNDMQMSRILQQPGLTDDERQKLYNASMEYVKYVLHAKRSNVVT